MSATEKEPTWELVTDFSVLRSGQRVKLEPMDCCGLIRGMLGQHRTDGISFRAGVRVPGTTCVFELLPYHVCATTVRATAALGRPRTVCVARVEVDERRVWREVLDLGSSLDAELLMDVHRQFVQRGVDALVKHYQVNPATNTPRRSR